MKVLIFILDFVLVSDVLRDCELNINVSVQVHTAAFGKTPFILFYFSAPE